MTTPIVSRFTGSATHRTLRGALAEHTATDRPDRALVVVCADDLQRALDTIDAYERGAGVHVHHTHVHAPAPAWVHTLATTIALGLLVAFAVLFYRQVRP